MLGGKPWKPYKIHSLLSYYGVYRWLKGVEVVFLGVSGAWVSEEGWLWTGGRGGGGEGGESVR